MTATLPDTAARNIVSLGIPPACVPRRFQPIHQDVRFRQLAGCDLWGSRCLDRRVARPTCRTIMGESIISALRLPDLQSASFDATEASRRSLPPAGTTSRWFQKREEPTDLVTTLMNVFDPSGNLIGSTTVVTILMIHIPSAGGPLLSQDLQGPGYVWITVWPNGWAGDLLGIDDVRADLLPRRPRAMAHRSRSGTYPIWTSEIR